MNYGKAQSILRSKYPPVIESESRYFHNYLFPHNEKRCYRNKLTLGLDGVVYLGVTLKDKTNRHWEIEKPNPTVKMIGYSADDERYDRHEPKIRLPRSKISKERKEPKQRTSHWEILRRQFDSLPESNKFCCYCEKPLDRYSVTRDHLLPKSKGGKGVNYDHENIRPCCVACNSEKSSLLLREYIGKLNIKFANMSPSSSGYEKLQRKIINANKIAIEINKL
jgi:5-methylcytosine-specific restriction endonuclease McrA